MNFMINRIPLDDIYIYIDINSNTENIVNE